MIKDNNNKKYGLNPTPPDARDFSLGGVFGVPKLSELPQSYEVTGPRFIKDQEETDMCTAFAMTAVSEDQEEKELSPFFTFAMTRKIMNADISEYGADLRSACKVAVQYGFLSLSDLPRVFNDMTLTYLAESGMGEVRDYFADWKNVPVSAVSKAIQHKKRTYLSVDGPYDTFDNMRAALWQTRGENRSIFTGINWRPSWNARMDGVILGDYDRGEKSYGHAVKVFGWKEFGGETFLSAQLSNGEKIGKGGIFYLSRETVNNECVFGAFTFSDMPKEQVKFKLGRISFLRFCFASLFA